MTHTMIPRTNYLMEKSPLRYKPRPVVMDAATADRTSLAKKKKDGPSRAMLKSISLSVLHV